MADPQQIPPPPDGSAIVMQAGGIPPPPDGSAVLAQGSQPHTDANGQPWYERYGKKLASSLGVPTSMEELEAMQPSTAEIIGGPAVTAGKMLVNYGKNAARGMKEGYEEVKEAAQNVNDGDDFLPNMVKAGYAGVHAGINAVPIIGPAINTAGEDITKGDYAGAAGGLTGVVGQLAAPELIKRGAPALRAMKDVVTDAFAKDLPAQSRAAHANFMKAIPPTKSAPYELGDLQKARPFLDDAHADSPIKTPQDVVDAANAGLSRIENHVSQAIHNHPGAQLTIDPVQAAKSAVAQSDLGIAKPEAVDAAGKELEPYGFEEPKTLAEADRIRRQLNSENRSFENRNNTVQFDARNTDPGYAARDAANDAIKGNLYDRLDDLGEHGISDLRQTEGSLVRIRNAAQNQIFNGDKAVGETGNNSSIANAGRNLVRAGATGAGVLAGEHLGGPWGATAGGIMGAATGEFVNKWAFPGNLTRAELLEKAFSKPVTEGATLPDIAPKPRIAGLLSAPAIELGPSSATNPNSEAPITYPFRGTGALTPKQLGTGATELPPSTLTNPLTEPSAVDATTRAFRKGLLLNAPSPQLPNPGYTEPQGEPIGTPIGSKAQPYEQPQGWPANAKSETAQAANPTSAAVPAQPANGRSNPSPAVYVPRQPELPVASGTRTDIKVPGSDQSYPAQYEVRELSDVHPSHSGTSFQPNPKYALTNDRDYSNPANQAKVVENSSPEKFDPSYHITDNPDATNGPIVIDSDGHALGGNGRAMILQRVYQHNQDGAAQYRMMLANKSPQFGVDPMQVLGMKQPVLVRKIADADLPHTEKQTAITDFNKVGTAQLTTAERALADSRRVSQGTLDSISARIESQGADATLSDALQGKSGTDILDKLIEDGVVSPQERAGLANENGLTIAGKDRISKLTVGRFFRDPAQMDATPAAIRNKLESIAAPLARVDGVDGWDLTRHVQDALDILEEARAHNLGNVRDVISQSSMFGGGKYSAESVAMAEQLKNTGTRALTKQMRQYAQDAQDATGQQQTFGSPVTADQAFRDAFGQ